MRRILWFRRDLRCDDHPLLSQEGDVLPIFIFDPHILGTLSPNDRRVTFIFEALIRLKSELSATGLDLALFYGDPATVIGWLLRHGSYDEVCASGDYDPHSMQRDRDVSHLLPFRYLHDTYIFRPEEVLKNDRTPYLVFTPFYNRAKALFTPEHMLHHAPADQRLIRFDYNALHRIDDTGHTLLPISFEAIGFVRQKLPHYYHVSPQAKLNRFAAKLGRYAADRDWIALEATSALSTDLRFGTLSVRALVRWITEQKENGIDTEPFFRQLIFREFYAVLLYFFPHLMTDNFRYTFRGNDNKAYFDAFAKGETGVPIVDAGIRELLETGKMHNRVRMICASFFTKNLLLPWPWGESFFARHLMDYDTASNVLSWQWSAGTGVDPQPYFRIFNPYLQAKKFDPDGNYIRRWIPELKSVDTSVLHDEKNLSRDSIPDYPKPIVDHKSSSKNALEHFKRHL